jgi:uncharacterized protein (DUF924 family)
MAAMADALGFEEVLDFWFGELDAQGAADAAHVARWFAKDEAFDAECRARFGAVHQAIVEGAREAWLETPRGRLAYVIVLDQLSRNMFRGTPRMFAFDAQALDAAAAGVERGDDRALASVERGFLYMPFMHAEDLEAQSRCVALFTALRDEAEGPRRSRLESNLDFAERHRAIIARFGRFPHRNAVLGRASTPEELAFLEEPGSSF